MEVGLTDICVMASDPAPNLTLEMAQEMFETIESELDLAVLYTNVENKFWWLEDDIYDYEEGSKEYIELRGTLDSLWTLLQLLKERIFDILRSEGIVVADKGQVKMVEPFMIRNGFKNANGWWINNI